MLTVIVRNRKRNRAGNFWVNKKVYLKKKKNCVTKEKIIIKGPAKPVSKTLQSEVTRLR